MIQLLWPRHKSTERPKPDPGTYDVLPPARLLAPHAPLIHEVREMVGVPDPHWRSLYDPMLHQYAGFVQQLPASEAHHHSGAGGLLAHGLEVLRNALKIRRGALLPRGAAPEEAARQQDLWTYAICSACLLHDVAKPVVDLRILLTDATGRSAGVWDPWSGPMPTDHRYRVTFVRDRQYHLHERLAPLFARLIVPQLGLSWLGSEREVLRQWTATLTSHPEEAGAIGEIVHQADGRSVAMDLGGEQTRMPGAKVKPLHERLITGLRYLIDHGELPLNANGAAGWITEDSAWLVVKRALDQLREHLQQEGQTGIPTRNDRLMDELQQHGVVIANGG
jgi:integrating conjugative element relaxase (TIGR03760 family)